MKEARYFQMNEEVAFKLVRAIEGIVIIDRDDYIDTIDLRQDLMRFIASATPNHKRFKVYTETEFLFLHPSAVIEIQTILMTNKHRPGFGEEVRNAIECLQKFITEVKS